MAEMLRCKACGYVTRESRVKDVCPACGLPRTVFESYQENISARRKFLLGLHLHPIAVHLPQALSLLVAVFLLGSLVLDVGLGRRLTLVADLLAVLLPFSVLAAIGAGLMDGKIRLKRLATPLLKIKMILGGALLLLSAPLPLLVWWQGDSSRATGILLGLSLGCLACQVFLGRIGSKLMYVRLKG